MGYVNMESMLSSISAKDAKEWELFSRENPIPEEKIIVQIAMIARTFASYFIKRVDKKQWSLDDFIPNFKQTSKVSKIKEVSKNLKSKIMGVVDKAGDKKAKEWVKKSTERNKINNELDKKAMVRGTDGKMYKYALEEFVPERLTPPKRLRGKK